MFICQLVFSVLTLTIKATSQDVNVHIDLKELENTKVSDDTNLVFHMDEEGGANVANATEEVEAGADYAEDDEDDSCPDMWTNCAKHATDNVCWKSKIKNACLKSCGLCKGELDIFIFKFHFYYF